MNRLPSGWTVKRFSSSWDHRFRTTRVTIYRFDRDRLEVRKEDKFWILLHEGKDTGHKFATAKDAIEHAEDARVHGH